MIGAPWIPPGRLEFCSSPIFDTLRGEEGGDGAGGFLFGGDGVDDLGGGSGGGY